MIDKAMDGMGDDEFIAHAEYCLYERNHSDDPPWDVIEEMLKRLRWYAGATRQFEAKTTEMRPSPGPKPEAP